MLRAIRRVPVSFVQTRMITSQAVVFSSHGEPADVLSTHRYEIDETNLDANAIVLRTLGAPVNPSDINQIQGVYPSQPEKTTALGTKEPSAVAGNEGLFEVIHIGSKVSKFDRGDWVVPTNVNFGTWRTHALAHEDEFTKVPNPAQSREKGKPHGLTINQGATLNVNPLTAYLMLTHYVKLVPGKDWFIQNGGNSAVGKYAIQIGKLLGINSVSVVRDRPNLDELKQELYDLGATKVITDEENNSREFSGEFKSWIKETGGDVKLGLNCVGGKSSTAVARKLSPNGLMLTYGGMSYQPVILPTSLHIFKNITSSGFWVTALTKNDPELKTRTLDQIISWYEDGKLLDAPSKESKFEGEDLADAYKKAVADSKNGKQLVTF